MPLTFAAFTVGALSLIGVPPFPGFISKWNLCTSAIAEGSSLAYAGIGVLLTSAFLTAIYMMTTLFRAYFPRNDFDKKTIKDAKDPGWQMCVPFVIFIAAMLALSCTAPQLMGYFEKVTASGL
jgi:multicomponent Na+:H+ antiporter subunit D